MSKKLILVLALLAGWLHAVAQATEQSIEPLEKFPRDTLKIATPDARLHSFDVWIAAEERRRMQGLMFVKSLPENAGMLFLYGSPQPVGMWMKNTYIPLDMLFIKADGRVARVAANTKPHSLDTVESGEDVVAVLELKGGTAAKLGIKRGAIVMHRVFGSDQR